MISRREALKACAFAPLFLTDPDLNPFERIKPSTEAEATAIKKVFPKADPFLDTLAGTVQKYFSEPGSIAFFAAMFAVESAWDDRAVSPAFAAGISQLTLPAAHDLGRRITDDKYLEHYRKKQSVEAKLRKARGEVRRTYQILTAHDGAKIQQFDAFMEQALHDWKGPQPKTQERIAGSQAQRYLDSIHQTLEVQHELNKAVHNMIIHYRTRFKDMSYEQREQIDFRFNPHASIAEGVRFFHQHLPAFQKQFARQPLYARDLALASYNAGFGMVQEHGRLPVIKETIVYHGKIHQYLEKILEELHG